jgi:hypothetical protein
MPRRKKKMMKMAGSAAPEQSRALLRFNNNPDVAAGSLTEFEEIAYGAG